MNKNLIASAFIVYGSVQGVYSALIANQFSRSIGVYLGVSSIIIGGEIAKERNKKKSKLVQEVIKE